LEAKRRGKPVVIIKGGATDHGGKAALAHTGKLAGADRAFDAIFRECAAIRVHSTEELLDVALQLASLRPGQLPRGRRAWITTFGGGSGVLGTDQCARAGLEVPPLDPATRQRMQPIFPALGSSLNPIDLTPGAVTSPNNRATLPDVLKTIAQAPNVDIGLFFSSGFGALAPQVAAMFEELRDSTDKPICLSWLAPPAGITQRFAEKGIVVFQEHARAIRAAGHIP
jgi:acyl-CoA synthetase (NDP forming)